MAGWISNDSGSAFFDPDEHARRSLNPQGLRVYHELQMKRNIISAGNMIAAAGGVSAYNYDAGHTCAHPGHGGWSVWFDLLPFKDTYE